MKLLKLKMVENHRRRETLLSMVCVTALAAELSLDKEALQSFIEKNGWNSQR
jgi:hypothetical protein